MRYACIDLETTGLDPAADQTLEIGIILDDWNNVMPVGALHSFHCYVAHEKVSGHPFAMSLNATILKKIGDFLQEKDKAKIREGWYNEELYLFPSQVVQSMAAFFTSYGYEPMHLNGAGKNFSAFDLNFLRQLPEFGKRIKFRHRALDPVMCFFDPQINKDVLPSLQECLRQADIERTVVHRGLQDAYDVVCLLRKKYGIPLE